MAYRYWCGECGFKTSWASESQGQQQQIDHYAKQHHGIVPGGQVEFQEEAPAKGHGCLQFVGVVILLLFLAAACRH